MKKIDRIQLEQSAVAGGCYKGNATAIAMASGSSTATAKIVIHEKIVIKLF
jgi:hypothetical protein